MGNKRGGVMLVAALLITAPAVAQQDAAPAGGVEAAGTPAPVIPALPGRPEHRRHTKGDPWEGINRKIYKLHTTLDKAIFRPAALGYKSIIPKFLRTGIRHFLSNLTEPIVFLNDLLQLKPKRAARTFARFVINSTVGLGGTLDVAKTAKLPHRNNGFGNTLARYGVGPGPYLFLPFIGPTDLRDLLGGQTDTLVLPLSIGKPFNRFDYQVSTFVVGGLDLRAENDAGFKALLAGAADPYATLRSVYQQSRIAEIEEIKGKGATTGLDDPLLDPADLSADPAAKPEGAPAPDAAPVTTAPDPVLAEPTAQDPADTAAFPAGPAGQPAPDTQPADIEKPTPAPQHALALFTL
ncbi:MAG: MlaA family lipoprotein [Sphingomonas sp.]